MDNDDAQEPHVLGGSGTDEEEQQVREATKEEYDNAEDEEEEEGMFKYCSLPKDDDDDDDDDDWGPSPPMVSSSSSSWADAALQLDLQNGQTTFFSPPGVAAQEVSFPSFSSCSSNEDLLALAEKVLQSLEDDYRTVAVTTATTTNTTSTTERQTPTKGENDGGALALTETEGDAYIETTTDQESTDATAVMNNLLLQLRGEAESGGGGPSGLGSRIRWKQAKKQDGGGEDAARGEAAAATTTTNKTATAAAATESLQRVVSHLRPPSGSSNKSNKKNKNNPLASSPSPPLFHAIIPPTPLKAFHRNTVKSREASYNLSRPATVAEALVRLNLWNGPLVSEPLRIHLVGVDSVVECASVETLQTMLRPLVRWVLGKPLEVVLVGLDIPSSLRGQTTSALTRQILGNEACSCSIQCVQAMYHDHLLSSLEPPHVAIAWNAGLWGYQDWKVSLRALSQSERVSFPFVVTSYSLSEAEEDEEVLQDILGTEATPVWGVEWNPFASRQGRKHTTTEESSKDVDNRAWQCWRIGGTKRAAQKEEE